MTESRIPELPISPGASDAETDLKAARTYLAVEALRIFIGRHLRAPTRDLFSTTFVVNCEPSTNVGRIFDNTHPCVLR